MPPACMAVQVALEQESLWLAEVLAMDSVQALTATVTVLEGVPVEASAEASVEALVEATVEASVEVMP